MADPVQFCGFNKMLNPAKGTEDHVRPLPVHGNGVENISCWKLSPEELAQVNKTGEVWFSVASGQTCHPVFASGFPMMEARDGDTGEKVDYYTDGRHAVEDARRFAFLHHGAQMYGEDKPYSYHLEKVVGVLRDFGAEWVHLVAGYCHDLEEDCWEDLPIETRREIVRLRFGDLAEQIIWCCTGLMFIDGVKQVRSARNAQIYEKIKAFPPAAPVKCGDRIANEEECVLTQSSMGKVYLDEALEFDDAVGIMCPPEMRLRHLNAALQIQAYVGDRKVTREALEERIAHINNLVAQIRAEL